MDPRELPDTTLTDLFRFAAILTGDAESGRAALSRALASGAGRIAELRGEAQIFGFLVRKIRDAVPANTRGSGALRTLHEPERSIAALRAIGTRSESEIGLALGVPRLVAPPQEAIEAAKSSARDLAVTPELLNAFRNDAAQSRHAAGPMGNPIIIAGAIGALVLFGLGIWTVIQGRSSIEGEDRLAEFVAANDRLTGMEFEPVQMRVGDLGDWLYVRGFEGFTAPPGFSGLKAVGARVFKASESPVAQIAIEEKHTIAFVFSAKASGIFPEPEGRWHFFSEGVWAAAARRSGDSCFVATFRGTRSEMRDFIGGLPDVSSSPVP